MGLTATLLKFVAGIAAEGLAFNARAIATVAKKAITGELLSEMLPSDRQLSDLLTNTVTRTVKGDLVATQQALEQDVWLNMIFTAVPLLMPPQGNQANDFVHSVASFLEKCLPEEVRAMGLEKLTSRIIEKAVPSTLLAFNGYFQHLADDPKVGDIKEKFNAHFEQFKNAVDPTQIEELKEKLAKLFVELKIAIDNCIERLLSQKLPRSFIQKVTEMALGNKERYEQFVTLSCQAANMASLQLNSASQKYLGVAILQNEHVEYLSLLLNLHVENIAKVVLMSYLDFGRSVEIQEDHLKAFYLNIAALVANTFQCSLGKQSSTFLFETVKRQILGSKITT